MKKGFNRENSRDFMQARKCWSPKKIIIKF